MSEKEERERELKEKLWVKKRENDAHKLNTLQTFFASIQIRDSLHLSFLPNNIWFLDHNWRGKKEDGEEEKGRERTKRIKRVILCHGEYCET